MTELEILPPLREATPRTITVEFILRRPKPKRSSFAVWPWLLLILACIAPHFTLIILPFALLMWLCRA